jgi:hypothetical protein
MFFLGRMGVTSSQKTGPARTGKISESVALQSRRDIMKKSKYSEEQIATALRQVDAGGPIPEVIERLESARLLIMCDGGSGMGRWPSLRSGDCGGARIL